MKLPLSASRLELKSGLSRRAFLRTASLSAAATLVQPPFTESPPDFRLEIAEGTWDLSPKRALRTSLYNSQLPGPLIRLREGRPATIEITNRLSHAEIVHWHGQWIPVAVDGAMEEGSPMIPPGATVRISFTPRPSGLHWYHTHTPANRNLAYGLYSGQSGILLVEPTTDPGRYDAEQFLVLQDWEPYFVASGDGSEMVHYVRASINGHSLGAAPPIQTKPGQLVLFHILNASATQAHWLSLPGHRFRVLALDGRPVPRPADVETLRLGPAERITAVVEMNTPGIWIMGEPRDNYRKAGMGIVIEYAGSSGVAMFRPPAALSWDYRIFGDAMPSVHTPDRTIPLVFTSAFRGHGALDRWMINGKSYPDTPPLLLESGLRHRLVFDNRSTDDHPVHLHRHAFELVSLRGQQTSGVFKDVVIVEAGTRVEADLVADNPGNSLFHCHQQDHMDSGFMALFRYGS